MTWTSLQKRLSAAGMGLALALAPGSAAPVQGAQRWVEAGPEGGWVNGLAFDAAGPATLYAALADGGVYRSEDRAHSWTPAREGLPPGTIRCLAADPGTSGTLYVGRATDGIWKSGDGGRSWSPLAATLGDAPADVRSLLADPEHPGTLYAGLFPGQGQSALWKSTDGGGHWSPLDLGSAGAQVNALAGGGGALFAAVRLGGVYRSLDGGSTWEKRQEADVRALAVQGERVYAAAANGVWLSPDRGETWERSTAGLPNLNLTGVVVHPLDAGLAWVAARDSHTASGVRPGGVFRTTDGGRSWSEVPGIPNAGLVQALLASPRAQESLYAAPGPLGVWVQRGGVVGFTSANRGLRAAYVSKLLADPKRPLLLYASADGLGLLRSQDGGASWSRIGTRENLHRALAIDPRRPDTVYAFGFTGAVQRLWRSRDAGTSWSAIDPEAGLSLASFAVDPSTPRQLYAVSFEAEPGVYRSSDGGDSWRRASPGCTHVYLSTVSTAHDLFLGGPSGCGSGDVEGGFERSEDGGRTFDNLRFGLPGSPFPSALASDPRAPLNLLADVSGWDASPAGTVFVHGIFRSTDRGASWSRVAGLGLLRAATTATDFAFPPAGGSAVWLATGGQGLFRSLDGGASFRPAAIPGLPSHTVLDLEFDRRAPAVLYAGTPGGLFRLAPD